MLMSSPREVTVIIVNIRRSGDDAATIEQVMEAASGDWVLSESGVDAYGDVLLAVRAGRVRGAFDILGWEQVGSGRIRFYLRVSEDLGWIVGQESPVRWRQGQSNPVMFLDTESVTDESSQNHKPPVKPRRGVHRIVLETKGLSDEQAARLHHALITIAMTTGAMHNVRTTSLVREMRSAKDSLDYDYSSASSPKAIKD